MQKLTGLQLTYRVALSLCDSRASCYTSIVFFTCLQPRCAVRRERVNGGVSVIHMATSHTPTTIASVEAVAAVGA